MGMERRDGEGQETVPAIIGCLLFAIKLAVCCKKTSWMREPVTSSSVASSYPPSVYPPSRTSIYSPISSLHLLIVNA